MRRRAAWLRRAAAPRRAAGPAPRAAPPAPPNRSPAPPPTPPRAQIGAEAGLGFPQWYDAGKVAIASSPFSFNTLLGVQFLLFAWVEAKRFLDLQNPGSQGDGSFLGVTDDFKGKENGYPGARARARARRACAHLRVPRAPRVPLRAPPVRLAPGLPLPTEPPARPRPPARAHRRQAL